jgi:hypothetical protein
MTDEHEVIAGLSPEQVVERAKALALEVEYWQQVLDDAKTMNGAVRHGTDAILESTTAALALATVVGVAGLELVETIIGGNRKALEALTTVSDRLNGMLELADGRTKALEPVGAALLRAAGVEPDEPDDREAS